MEKMEGRLELMYVFMKVGNGLIEMEDFDDFECVKSGKEVL